MKTVGNFLYKCQSKKECSWFQGDKCVHGAPHVHTQLRVSAEVCFGEGVSTHYGMSGCGAKCVRVKIRQKIFIYRRKFLVGRPHSELLEVPIMRESVW